MSRFRLFMSNFLVYGLGSIISKIIPLLMLPLITRVMADAVYFGINDLYTIVVSFATSLSIMGMYDAMFRLFFEKEDEEFKKRICSSALAYTTCASIIVTIIMVLFKEFFAKLIWGSEEYDYLLLLSVMSVLVGTTNTIVAAPTRFNNERKVFLITNTIAPIISYSISIPLLLRGWYIIALPLASILSAVIIESVFFIRNKKWFSIRYVDRTLIKQLLIIALPLIADLLVYWVFNSVDRLMISKILGNREVGIYAIGSKIGQASQLIYTAFAGGWQYFAFSTMKDKDQVEMNSHVFEYLGVISFAATMLLTSIMREVFQLIFTGDYVLGASVAPYLFLNPLLLMLVQVAGNQFLVIKITWPSGVILTFGALVNVILNFIMIPMYGIEGAAAASTVAYVIALIITVVVLKQMKLFVISRRFIYSVLIFIIFFMVWRFITYKNIILSISFAIICISGYFILYKNKIIQVIKQNI